MRKKMSNKSNANIDNETRSHQIILQELNDREAGILLPVVIYVLVLMIAGVVGNSTVLYVYKFRFRRSSSRAFILCLAVLDLVTCLFGMPFHIIDMRFPYMFIWDIPCKILCFLLTSTILSSTFILVLISVERYRKICLPFEKQISDVGTRGICCGCIFAAFVISSPVLLLYDSTSFETNVLNVTGYECYISDGYRESIFPLIYDATTIVLFIASTCTLCVLYSKIGLTVWRKGTFQGNNCKTKKTENSSKHVSEQLICSNSQKIIETSFIPKIQCPQTSNERGNTFDAYSNVLLDSPRLRKDFGQKVNKNLDIRRSSLRLKRKESKRSSIRNSFRNSFRLKTRSISSEDSSSESFSSTLERKSRIMGERLRMANKLSRKQRRTIRITGMLILITIIFIISFLPYLVISILNGLDENFWKDMDKTEILIFNFLQRTYFVNNMANPLIYGFLDEKFRSEVRKIFRCC